MIGKVVISNSDGSTQVMEKEFEEPKTSQYEIQKIIESKKKRLEELTKDFEQDRIGFVIPNLEERKQEFKTLLNEVRLRMGKDKRELQNQLNDSTESSTQN